MTVRQVVDGKCSSRQGGGRRIKISGSVSDNLFKAKSLELQGLSADREFHSFSPAKFCHRLLASSVKKGRCSGKLTVQLPVAKIAGFCKK